jgi:hypothetical protein
MVDHETTTDNPMTADAAPAVGVAPVHTPDPEPAPALNPAPMPPPLAIAPVDEVLRWIATVSVMAGSPSEMYISVVSRKIDISTSSQRLFIRWQTMTGATPQAAQYDALGTVISATSMHTGRWSVTIKAHIGTTLGATP